MGLISWIGSLDFPGYTPPEERNKESEDSSSSESGESSSGSSYDPFGSCLIPYIDSNVIRYGSLTGDRGKMSLRSREVSVVEPVSIIGRSRLMKETTITYETIEIDRERTYKRYYYGL
jgi:hypothetical protein